jgi:ABC-type glycerol-3-phosphate transport system substrate-binding protein
MALPTSPVPTQYTDLLTVRIWVTPRFDPAKDSVLQARLDAFSADHAGLKIEVRVKEEASLLESLRLTVFAAPDAAPDLIALSRADLEGAVAQGLIQPMNAGSFDGEPWHPLARSLGQVNDSAYSLPFALDALALATVSGGPLLDWQAISRAGTLAINVNDASLPLALYLSAGGELTDAGGSPMLDKTTLTRVLNLFANGNYLALESDEQVASALEGGSAAAAGWSSIFLAGGNSTVQLDALPGLESPSATLVTSWGWSVVSMDADRQELALALAKWLTTEEFLGTWTSSRGYVTPLPDVRWKPLLDPARIVPAAEVAAVVSPILRDAVLSVLNGTSPEDTAREAVDKLK